MDHRWSAEPPNLLSPQIVSLVGEALNAGIVCNALTTKVRCHSAELIDYRHCTSRTKNGVSESDSPAVSGPQRAAQSRPGLATLASTT